MRICFLMLVGVIILRIVSCQNNQPNRSQTANRGNVIFIHPDGSGIASWAALRVLEKGPDGMLNWDRLSHLGIYRDHLTNALSSNGAATVHAYGVKVPYHSYGTHEQEDLVSLSGADKSVMQEAQEAGMAVAVINSGHLCEPGSGVFLASYPDRKNTDIISLQIIESGADIILSGGETLLLPEGMMGKHGKPGVRMDDRNLIQQASDSGYQVVYTRDELLALSAQTKKVLGVFAAGHTFNDETEEDLQKMNVPLYVESAPTAAEMLQVTLQILESKKKPFLVVLEEEGSDNFANKNNARGMLESLRRADLALGVALDFVNKYPNTMLMTTADSDAGGMQMIGIRDPEKFEEPLPETEVNGAPLDGRDGTGTPPFTAAPDQFGNRLRFGICWASSADLGGGVVTKAHGLNAHLLPQNVDNTDIYRMIYATLFGKWLP
jgi:alkaline phosphatase